MPPGEGRYDFLAASAWYSYFTLVAFMHLACNPKNPVVVDAYQITRRITPAPPLHTEFRVKYRFRCPPPPPLSLPPFLFSFLFPPFCKTRQEWESCPVVVGMKNAGNKKERDFLSRNIVRHKGRRDTLVPYSQKDFHCPRRRRR